jgi:type II secretion system protein G
MKIRSNFAFTLIELLVVVAIIAILAAIAVPNFLEAQTRSKVSRAKADMATVTTALEAYAVDNNAYPVAVLVPGPFRLRRLTTPVSYISSLPEDPFRAHQEDIGPFSIRVYMYGSMGVEKPSRWALASVGPDRQVDTDPIQFYPGYTPELFYGGVAGFDYTLYDPTNGTISRGDIFRASDYNPG